VDIDPTLMTGREACERLLGEGILAKEAHGQTVRLAPPLVAGEDDIDLLVDAFGKVLRAG
jgi:ornithine--oxo-acid transaminase